MWIQVEVIIIIATRMIHKVRIIIVITIIIIRATIIAIIVIIVEEIIAIIVIIETDNMDRIFSWLTNMYHVIIIPVRN